MLQQTETDSLLANCPASEATGLLNSPLLCNLILPLHFLLLKLSDIPHSNLLTEFHKHLILHLGNRNNVVQCYMFINGLLTAAHSVPVSPGSCGRASQ